MSNISPGDSKANKHISIRQPKRNPDHVLLSLVLNDLQSEPSAWPFTKPVDRNVVVDYYDVIKEPMGELFLNTPGDHSVDA